jgi:2-keto-3-deoxy-L-rhamnonate aldolase RhmA
MGLARAKRYGVGFQDYVAGANREIAAIVQAEHIDAVNHIEAIAVVPGIDAIFVGPYDLSASMGKPGRVQDPDVQAAIARVRDVTLAAGLKLGIYCSDPESARDYLRQGYTLIAMGTDLNYLTQSAMAALASAKRD